uniref:Uncharacterized protein n=1 Tax=Daucus carota subsp. sativus TaxID=79200 RepID=A0A166G8B4_DAUCS
MLRYYYTQWKASEQQAASLALSIEMIVYQQRPWLFVFDAQIMNTQSLRRPGGD